jgi:hypothetical protein
MEPPFIVPPYLSIAKGLPYFFIIIPLVHIFILPNLDARKVFKTLDPMAALVRCRSQHLLADSGFFWCCFNFIT